jgi:Fic family protein
VYIYRNGNGRTARLLLNLMLMQEWRLGYLQALSLAETGHMNLLINLTDWAHR